MRTCDKSINSTPPFIFMWRGKYCSWMSDREQLTLVSVFYRLCMDFVIYTTKPKPKRHNLLPFKWWCEQSSGSWGRVEVGWQQRLRDGGGGRRRHTSAGTQAVGAWMGFCHEWITTRNVGWGEDESFTRLSLFISCDPYSGLWNKQIPQWGRKRGKRLFFSLGGE